MGERREYFWSGDAQFLSTLISDPNYNIYKPMIFRELTIILLAVALGFAQQSLIVTSQATYLWPYSDKIRSWTRRPSSPTSPPIRQSRQSSSSQPQPKTKISLSLRRRPSQKQTSRARLSVRSSLIIRNLPISLVICSNASRLSHLMTSKMC